MWLQRSSYLREGYRYEAVKMKIVQWKTELSLNQLKIAKSETLEQNTE